MASITPYEGGRYRAVVRRAGYKARSKIFPTLKLAKAWARDIESDMDKVKYRDPAKDLKTTVAELFEKFRAEVAPSRKGARWEQVRLGYFLRTADFVHRRLDQITSEDLRSWRDERLKKVSAASVNRELNLISGVFSHAIKEWGLPLVENPVHHVKRPAGTGRHRNRRVSEQEIGELLRAAGWQQDRQPAAGRDYVGWAILIAVETAMRLGEICSIRIADIDPPSRCITLHDTKNGDTRAVPLSTKALEMVTFLSQGRGAHELLVPLAPESLGLYFREARKKAGLVGVRFHDTRHEAATRMSQKLTNVLELSAVTGHRSLQSLKRYYNPRPHELAAKLD